MSKHNLLGNCWDKEIVYADDEMNDICDDHDQPRGECSECPDCPQCKLELK